MRMRIGTVVAGLALALIPAGLPSGTAWAGTEEAAAAIEAQLPSVTNVTERVRLQLRLGDVASAMLQDKPRALAAWRTVAEDEAAHPYYRALAMDKLAHTLLYREPLPNHLMASFPERQAMPAAQTNPEKLEEAVGWWRRAAALDLKAWVRLESLVGMARAYEACGKPVDGLAVLERDALALSDLNPRQAAEVKFIMAQLALAAGDRPRAAALARGAAATPQVRPQLVEAAGALVRETGEAPR